MDIPNGNESDAPVVRMCSIAHGVMGEESANNPQGQLSLSDINNVLAQQAKATQEQFRVMQERIDFLEKQQLQLQMQPRGSASTELTAGGELFDGEDEGTLDEEKSSRPVDENGTDDPQEEDELTTERRRLTSSEIEIMYDDFPLPESTYTLLMTERILSIPFAMGITAVALCVWCLVLAFLNELDNGSPGNPLGLPAGVPNEVRMAQYLGIIVGVLMEEEIPQGLELIGKGAEQRKSGSTKFSMNRIVLPAILRLAVGYTFLLCLFLVVVQEQTVLDIFFDILALEFVENIDDVAFSLSKRGFFGHELRVVCNNRVVIESSRESHRLRRCMKRFIRFVYVCNMCGGIAVLTYYTQKQMKGHYRCNTVSVNFGHGDDVWEEAYDHSGDIPKQRLLVYSHFNGVYVENGTHDGHPKYTEQNKEDGSEFQRTTPAEIIYCGNIESWVFRHPHIRTTNITDQENECSWLLKSPRTESFDIIDLAEETDWFVWKGLIESEYKVSIECDECDDNADCNNNGICNEEDERCDCLPGYFGPHCQYLQPCDAIRSEKDNTTVLQLLRDPDDPDVDFVEVYGRPMYTIENLRDKPYGLLRLGYPEDDKHYYIDYPNSTGTGNEDISTHKHYHPVFFEDDDFFEQNNVTTKPEFQQLLKNYTFVLRFTGRRWYGQMIPPGMTAESFKEEEYHAFWNNAFSGLGEEDNSTLIISAPSFGLGSPVGVDFYEMRRRNIAFETGHYDFDYSPFGVLIPLVEYEGSGFFHCNRPDV